MSERSTTTLGRGDATWDGWCQLWDSTDLIPTVFTEQEADAFEREVEARLATLIPADLSSLSAHLGRMPASALLNVLTLADEAIKGESPADYAVNLYGDWYDGEPQLDLEHLREFVREVDQLSRSVAARFMTGNTDLLTPLPASHRERITGIVLQAVAENLTLRMGRLVNAPVGSVTAG